MIILTQPPERWSKEFQARQNQALTAADRMNRKTGADIELVTDRLILRSPNGSRFALVVANDGTLSTTAL